MLSICLGSYTLAVRGIEALCCTSDRRVLDLQLGKRDLHTLRCDRHGLNSCTQLAHFYEQRLQRIVIVCCGLLAKSD